ncbi:hypothetical protein SUGI_0728000 [Cryptomeria japonica]|nr:hypothetical protein SUGI_0728000 [Cryptomeria japonica]
MERSPLEEHFPTCEIDLKCEFSAPKYFDFIKGETEEECQQSEAWFETAPTDPPSPIYTVKNRGKTSFSSSEESKEWFQYIISKQGEIWIESANGCEQSVERERKKVATSCVNQTMLLKDKSIARRFQALNS